MIESKNVLYAKEVDDVMVLLTELVADIKAKKNLAVIASENLPNLFAALSGVDQVGAELNSNPKVVVETIGYRLGDLIDALLFPSVETSPAA